MKETEMKTSRTKQLYVPPQIEVLEVEVEMGFAQSNGDSDGGTEQMNPENWTI